MKRARQDSAEPEVIALDHVEMTSPMETNAFPVAAGRASETALTRTATESHLRLLREEKGCDVTFIVGESKERIQCHQLFLTARSPVFETMFSERWDEGKKQVELLDTDVNTFRAFLEFMYADKFVVSISEAVGLLEVAHKYDIQLLEEKCEQLLDQEVELRDCVAVFQAARKYGHPQYTEAAGEVLARSFWELLADDGSLVQMDKDTFSYLLKRDDLKAKEVDVFKIALKWGNNQVNQGATKSLKEALEDIIPLIRFPVMTMNEFTLDVVPLNLLSQENLVQIFTYFGSSSDKAAQKNLEQILPFSARLRAAPAKHGKIRFYSGINASDGFAASAQSSLWDAIGFAAEIFPKHGIQVSEAPQRGTQSVAITSIILQCPLKEVRNSKRPAKSDSDNAFDLYIANVAFQRAGTFEDNCIRLSTSTIKLMWGREMEVKVTPPVQLENGNNYMIFLDQVEPVLYLDLKNPSRTEVVFERRLAKVVTFSYFSYFGLRATVPEGRETVSVSRPRGTQVIH